MKFVSIRKHRGRKISVAHKSQDGTHLVGTNGRVFDIPAEGYVIDDISPEDGLARASEGVSDSAPFGRKVLSLRNIYARMSNPNGSTTIYDYHTYYGA